MNNNEKVIFEQLIAFKNENEEELKLVPLLWAMLEDAVAYHTDIALKVKEEEKTSKVLTQNKEDIFDDLILDTANVEGMLSSYGNYKKFVPFQKIEHCKKSELIRTKDEDILTNVDKMITVIKDAPAERAEAGITDERLAALEAKYAAALDILFGPVNFRLRQKDLNKEIETELKAFRRLLCDSIKPNMHSNFADANPDLYNAFRNAIHTDALPKKTKVITGSFKNEKGEPVSDVLIQLDEEKPVKKGGEKGQFYFYNVPAGQHSLVFTKESYKQEKRVFMIEADHCMHFDITFILEELHVESETEA
ncbi:carboxypeptidase-like regulatory domain-containing protein [Marinifilum flexuosum]|uniref:carboxypeptidase-like regulatory domain-containing protein n=1 Tax=Marinifilum flexuosum TaxID=1117708 RepID=UPI00249479FB|nr:carboxypeptidase-like regulatory domain-containing protein [Marinifilum flexuosum]